MVVVVAMRTSSYVNYYVLCLVCWILLGITGVSTRSHSLVKRYTGLYPGPYFDSDNPENFTAQLGTHAFLPCKVRQLGNKSVVGTYYAILDEALVVVSRDEVLHTGRTTHLRLQFTMNGPSEFIALRREPEFFYYFAFPNTVSEVSWIRKKDAHILSVDRVMFIADERFQAIFVDGSETWKLQVKYVQARDEGDYECQISTEPKTSHFVHLNVVVPKVEIVGDRDMHVRTGSTVSLRCVINQSLEAPSYVFWYHKGDRLLGDHYGKLDIHPPTKTETGFDSSLVIHNARIDDSGNYTCSPSNLDSASVSLHVLNGEHPAAIQRGISAAPGGCRALWWLAGSVSLSSNHGRRIFVLVVLISMVFFTYQRSLRLAYSGNLPIVR